MPIFASRGSLRTSDVFYEAKGCHLLCVDYIFAACSKHSFFKTWTCPSRESARFESWPIGCQLQRAFSVMKQTSDLEVFCAGRIMWCVRIAYCILLSGTWPMSSKCASEYSIVEFRGFRHENACECVLLLCVILLERVVFRCQTTLPTSRGTLCFKSRSSGCNLLCYVLVLRSKAVTCCVQMLFFPMGSVRCFCKQLLDFEDEVCVFRVDR